MICLKSSAEKGLILRGASWIFSRCGISLSKLRSSSGPALVVFRIAHPIRKLGRASRYFSRVSTQGIRPRVESRLELRFSPVQTWSLGYFWILHRGVRPFVSSGACTSLEFPDAPVESTSLYMRRKSWESFPDKAWKECLSGATGGNRVPLMLGDSRCPSRVGWGMSGKFELQEGCVKDPSKLKRGVICLLTP